MSDLAWEALSDQAIAAAGVLYFVALLAYVLGVVVNAEDGLGRVS